MPEPRDGPTGTRLNVDDSIELAALLSFLSAWLECQDVDLLAASLKCFIGTTGYELAELQADIGYFASLLEDGSEGPLRPDQGPTRLGGGQRTAGQ
jgi:hypothetical protein